MRAGVVAGLPVAAAVVDAVCGDAASAFEHLVTDGDRVEPGTAVARVHAPTRLLLTAERSALNLLCHLSGVATLTRRWVDALAGTATVVRDTRKTTPGLRALEKYAVRVGGGANHRMGLSDAALVKDNHVAAAGGVAAAFAAVRSLAASIPVEIEVDSLAGLTEALAAGADTVLLDNFTPALMTDAVALRDRLAPGVTLEASGGLSLAVAAEVGATGVDFVAVGELTHSAPVLDLGLDLGTASDSRLRLRSVHGQRECASRPCAGSTRRPSRPRWCCATSTPARVVAIGRGAHPPTEPPVSEQDPAAWWAALRTALADIEPGLRQRVVGIAVGGQQHGLVVTDATGRPLRPAPLWNDTTSADQATRLVETFGAAWWAQRCGSLPVAAFTITKLAALRERHPDVFDAVARVMLPHDWLTFGLCGEHVTDRGDASGTGWFDTGRDAYSAELIATVVGEAAAAAWLDRLPAVRPPFAAVGTLLAATAEQLGLPSGIPVGPGSGDNMAAALGIGLGVGEVAVSLGTSGTVYTVSPTPTHDTEGFVAGFADASGRFLPLVCTLNATKVTDTVAGWLGRDAGEFAELAQSADPAATQPVVVPYFDGERTPNLPTATGSVHGLRPSTSAADIARAAHLGVLCGLLDGRDELAHAGAPVTGAVRLVGGGANSPAYRQLLADLVGDTIVVPTVVEAVATGACVQAAVVAGGGTADDVVERWRLGEGIDVTPRPGVDGSACREAYAAAVTGMTVARSEAMMGS